MPLPDIPSNASEPFRRNAGNCLALEDTAADDVTRLRFKRLGAAWLALAETQDWLDGVTSPVSRPQPSSGDLMMSRSEGSRGVAPSRKA
jgi:hypothetical protein